MNEPIDLNFMPTLPQAPEVEEAVLACLFAEKEKPEVVADIFSQLKPEDFYQSIHTEVFKACLELFQQGKPISEEFANDQLRKNLSHLPQVSGDFIDSLQWKYQGSGNLGEQIKVLKTKSVNRQAITEYYNIIWNKVNDNDLIDHLQNLVLSLSTQQSHQTEAPIHQILPDVIADIETRWQNCQALQGISTGFKKLDGLIGGLQKTRLITLCARTGIGKTSYALAMATHIARELQKPVLYASLEMSKEELASRAVCQVEKLDSSTLRNETPSKETYSRFLNAMVSLDNVPLILDDSPQTLTSLRAKAKRVMAQYGELGLLVVDYLGLIRTEEKGQHTNRYQAVSTVVRGLKDLALELKIPVLCLAQPNRQVDQRGDNKLRLSDLKDSGEIEQASDVVIFLNRKAGDPQVELEIAKQRNGPLGSIKYRFVSETTTFGELW